MQRARFMNFLFRRRRFFLFFSFFIDATQTYPKLILSLFIFRCKVNEESNVHYGLCCALHKNFPPSLFFLHTHTQTKAKCLSFCMHYLMLEHLVQEQKVSHSIKNKHFDFSIFFFFYVRFVCASCVSVPRLFLASES